MSGQSSDPSGRRSREKGKRRAADQSYEEESDDLDIGPHAMNRRSTAKKKARVASDSTIRASRSDATEISSASDQPGASAHTEAPTSSDRLTTKKTRTKKRVSGTNEDVASAGKSSRLNDSTVANTPKRSTGPRAGQTHWSKIEEDMWKHVHNKFKHIETWKQMTERFERVCEAAGWTTRGTGGLRSRLPKDENYQWPREQLECVYNAMVEGADNDQIYRAYVEEGERQKWNNVRRRKLVIEKVRDMRTTNWRPETYKPKKKDIEPWRPEEDEVLRRFLRAELPTISKAVSALEDLGLTQKRRTFVEVLARINELKVQIAISLERAGRWGLEEPDAQPRDGPDSAIPAGPSAGDENEGRGAQSTSKTLTSEADEDEHNISIEQEELPEPDNADDGMESEGCWTLVPGTPTRGNSEAEDDDVSIPGADFDDRALRVLADNAVQAMCTAETSSQEAIECHQASTTEPTTPSMDVPAPEMSSVGTTTSESPERSRDAPNPPRPEDRVQPTDTRPGDDKSKPQRGSGPEETARTHQAQHQDRSAGSTIRVSIATDRQSVEVNTSKHQHNVELPVNRQPVLQATTKTPKMASNVDHRDVEVQEGDQVRLEDHQSPQAWERITEDEADERLRVIRAPPEVPSTPRSDPYPNPESEEYDRLPHKLKIKTAGGTKDLAPWMIHFYNQLASEGSSMKNYLKDYAKLKFDYKAMKYDSPTTPTGDTLTAIPMYEERRLSFTFAISLLMLGVPYRAMFQRELWASNYGECRAKDECCLKWDITNREVDYEGNCRHWEYFRYREVYVDNIAHEGDYRLALALSTHLMAMRETYISDEDARRKMSHHLQVRGYGPTSPCCTGNDKWNRRHEFDHWRVMTGMTTMIFLKAADPEDAGRLDQWEFGHVCTTDNKRIGHAILMLMDETWFFLLTSLTMYQVERALIKDSKRVNGQEQVSWWVNWKPINNLLNYQRRFLATHSSAGFSMVDAMARRSVILDSRPERERERSAEQQVHDVFRMLSFDQSEVVERALGYSGIIVNRGPYGCGKTTTITTCMEALYTAFREQKIAVVSETNAAIDEDLVRLLKNGTVSANDILRVGEMREGMEPYAHAFLNEKLRQLRRRMEQEGRVESDIVGAIRLREKELIDEARVIVTTLAHMGGPKLQAVEFATVINDEAGQTLEGALLQAIRRGTRLLVKVGDERQLRGWTSLRDDQRESFERNGRRHKINWSLMHSIGYEYARRHPDKDPSRFAITVRNEYRSHSRLTKLLEGFYDYELVPSARESAAYLAKMRLPEVSALSPKEGFACEDDEEVMGLERVLWFGSEQEEWRPKKEVFNHVELYMALELLVRIRGEIKRQQTRKSVFVITPYNKQAEQMRKTLRNYHKWFVGYLDIIVEVTDKSQGREADIVIASMTRTKTPGFLRAYPARTLVTLSRARDYLFILACRRAFEQEDCWNVLEQRAQLLRIIYTPIAWSTKTVLHATEDISTLAMIGSIDNAREKLVVDADDEQTTGEDQGRSRIERTWPGQRSKVSESATSMAALNDVTGDDLYNQDFNRL